MLKNQPTESQSVSPTRKMSVSPTLFKRDVSPTVLIKRDSEISPIILKSSIDRDRRSGIETIKASPLNKYVENEENEQMFLTFRDNNNVDNQADEINYDTSIMESFFK